MESGSKLRAEALRSLAFGSILSSYVSIGTPINEPSRMMIIQNFTDADLLFSFTGHTDHLPIKANSSIIFDATTNKTNNADYFFSAKTHVHVKRIGTPTTGSVYVSTLYGATR